MADPVYDKYLVEERATLNFRKFKVAINPTNRRFLNFSKSWVSSCLPNVDKKNV